MLEKQTSAPAKQQREGSYGVQKLEKNLLSLEIQLNSAMFSEKKNTSSASKLNPIGCFLVLQF